MWPEKKLIFYSLLAFNAHIFLDFAHNSENWHVGMEYASRRLFRIRTAVTKVLHLSPAGQSEPTGAFLQYVCLKRQARVNMGVFRPWEFII